MNHERKSRHRFFLLVRSRTPPTSSWIPLWNSNGADSHFCHYAYVTSCLGEKKNTTVGSQLAGRAFHETTKKMSESRILVRLLRMYFPRNWEFGSALSKPRNFVGGGLNTPPPVRHWCRPLCTPAINTSRNVCVSKQKIKILPPIHFCIKALPVSSRINKEQAQKSHSAAA